MGPCQRTGWKEKGDWRDQAQSKTRDKPSKEFCGTQFGQRRHQATKKVPAFVCPERASEHTISRFSVQNGTVIDLAVGVSKAYPYNATCKLGAVSADKRRKRSGEETGGCKLPSWKSHGRIWLSGQRPAGNNTGCDEMRVAVGD